MTGEHDQVRRRRRGSASHRAAGGGRILRNFSYLTAGKLLGDLFMFAVFVVLSRMFGEEGIGQYSFAIALTGFFVVFADYGLYYLGIKAMGGRKGSPARYYSGIFAARLALSGAAFAALLLTLVFLPFSPAMTSIIVLVGAFQITCTLLDGFATVFLAREDMRSAALIELSLRASTALAVIGAALLTANLTIALATMPVLCLAHVLLAAVLVQRRYGRLRPRTSRTALVRTLRQATPYAWSGILYQISARTDVVLLGFLMGAAVAGLYNVAYRVIFLLQFLPHFAAIALLPLASRLFVSDARVPLLNLYREAVNLAVLVGLPAAAGLWLIAPELIALIFGAPFAQSGAVLRGLSALLLLACLRHILGVFLTACDQQDARTRSEWAAALINAGGNLVLIPLIGMHGAVAATLVSETVLVILFALRLRPLFGWPRIGSRLAMSGLGTAAFCAGALLLPWPSLVVMIPMCALLYLAILALFRDFRRRELSVVLDLVRGEPPRPDCRAGEALNR